MLVLSKALRFIPQVQVYKFILLNLLWLSTLSIILVSTDQFYLLSSFEKQPT